MASHHNTASRDRGGILRCAISIGNLLLEHAHHGVSAIDISEQLGLERRTAIRYLNTMWQEGWADPTTLDPKPGRKWRPGPVLTTWSNGQPARRAA